MPTRLDWVFFWLTLALACVGYFAHLWPVMVVTGFLILSGFVKNRRRFRRPAAAFLFGIVGYGFLWLMWWRYPV